MKAQDIIVFQERKKKLNTIGEFKALGRELRDKFNLTDREAMDLLNKRNEMAILEKYDEK